MDGAERRIEIDDDSERNDVFRDRALTALLVVELLMLFVLAPLAAMGINPPLDIGGALAVLLILAIVMRSPSLTARVLTVIAMVLGVAGAAIRIRDPSPATFWLGHGAAIVAVCAISLVVAQAVFAPGRVNVHRIQGAIVLYLNTGVMFSSLYRLIAELIPGAFTNFNPDGPEREAVSRMLYFSFTVLTSTGLGDIAPIQPLARGISNLESVVGPFYLAILIARLVTLHVEASHRQRLDD